MASVPANPAGEPLHALDSVVVRAMPHYRRVAEQRIAIWPVVLVIYATLAPREVSIHLGGNFLYLDRIALVLTLPWVALHIWRGAIRFVLPDWLILFLGIWMFVAISDVEGLDRGMVSGVSLAFDAIAGYYLARISFRSLDDMRKALILCAPGFFIAALTVAIESVSHKFFVRPFFASIFGGLNYSNGTDSIDVALRPEIRHGLMRGLGPWVHPIDAGLHLATLLGIYWMSSVRGWPLWLALAAAMCAVFTVSSAALMVLVLIIAALVYDELTFRVRELSWPLAVGVFVLAIAMISVVSQSGVISVLIRLATLDPSTGYYRIAIWTYASQSVWLHPWFGIGFSAYQRPEWMASGSVDSHWLLYAVRYGLPAALALFVACLSAIGGLVRAEAMAGKRDARFYRGIMISLVALVIMAFTVMLQGGTLTWFTLLLGGCVACAQHTYVVDWAFWIRRKPRIATPIS